MPSDPKAAGEPAPLVSVVMPVYNGELFLAEAIESILTQTHSDLELIVVDDCSTDGSAAIVREYANRDQRVRLVQHDRNRGSGPARNSGIAVSRGEYIAAMDSDDISLPQRLEKQAAFLQANPDIGVVAAYLQTAAADLTERQSHEFPRQHVFIILDWILWGRTTMPGAVYMARREALLAVGGYKDAPIYADDRVLYARLMFETRFANLPETLYLYRQHANQKSEFARRNQQAMREDNAIRRAWLKRVSASFSPASLERLERLLWSKNFGWSEWWLLRRDFRRLLRGMVAAQVLDRRDITIAEAETRKRLESVKPRRWQMFIHWRRHRLGF